jgi:RNA polymerase sigma-70 factor (ECF subfamily)
MKYAVSRLRDAGKKDFVLYAEDAVQNTFMRIAKFIDRINFSRGEKDVKNYCFTILHNEIFKILEEKENLFGNFEEYCEENEYSIIEKLEIRERYDEVVKAIKCLDQKYSTTLYLVYFEEMTVNEIAEMMGISTQTVYTRLARGKQLLRNSLKGAMSNE